MEQLNQEFYQEVQLQVYSGLGIEQEEIDFIISITDPEEKRLYLKGLLYGIELDQLKSLADQNTDTEKVNQYIMSNLADATRDWDHVMQSLEEIQVRAKTDQSNMNTMMETWVQAFQEQNAEKEKAYQLSLESREETLRALKHSYDTISDEYVRVQDEKKELQIQVSSAQAMALKLEKESAYKSQQLEILQESLLKQEQSVPRAREHAESKRGIFSWILGSSDEAQLEYIARKEHEEKQFIDQILLSDKYDDEQKQFLQSCFNAGDSYYQITKYAHPKLSVQFMRDIRERRKKEGY